MIPKSIQWRLPLSYAGIALLATLALGGAMLAILRAYYWEQERAFLDSNAQALSAIIVDIEQIGAPQLMLEQYVQGFSFLTQARVRVLDENHDVIVDSGSPEATVFPSIYAIGNSSADITQMPEDFAETSGVTFGFFEVGDEVPLSGGTVDVLSLELPSLSAVGTPLDMDPELEQSGSRSSSVALWPMVDSDNQITRYIELSEGPAYGTQILKSVIRGWLIASGIAVLVAAVVGWFASRRITKPLLALNQATMAMSEGTFSVRADAGRGDELGQLARSFNQMADYVEETIATLRRFVSDAAHELHTPLTALRTNLELTENEPDAYERHDLLEQAQTQVSRLEDLTNNLLALSRIESGMIDEGHTAVNLTALVQETSELYASRAEQEGVIFTLDVGERPIFVQGSDSQLRNAVGNLLDNAIKFTAPQEVIKVSLTEEDGQALLRVTDEGIGIPEEELSRLFSRFYRGRYTAEYPGSGLGLAIVKAIVEAHGGSVKVDSDGIDQGSVFAVSIPSFSE